MQSGLGNIVTITIYHDPNCATSRDVLALIRNSGEEPETIEYLEAPPSRETFVGLLRRMDIPVRDLLRQEVPPYEEFGLDDVKWADDALIDLMLRHPVLMNRPIVVSPLGVRLCRPSETVLNILPASQEGAFRKENGAPVIDDQGRRVDRTALD
jgi:arsenate reductase